MRGMEDALTANGGFTVHQHAMEFHVRAMTAKLLGVWAAKQMGQDDASAQRYADTLSKCGGLTSDPIDQVRADLKRAGFAPGDQALRLQYEDFLDQARETVAFN